MHIPGETRPPGSKLFARSVEERFVGYTRSNNLATLETNQNSRTSRRLVPTFSTKNYQSNLTIREPPQPETHPPTANSVPTTSTQTDFDDLDLQLLIRQSTPLPTPPPRSESPIMLGSFDELEPIIRRCQRSRRPSD